jgi:hypothetical protein
MMVEPLRAVAAVELVLQVQQHLHLKVALAVMVQQVLLQDHQ